MIRAMITADNVNLRSWPDLPTADQPNNIVRVLSKGQNVSADELMRVTAGGRTWLPVAGEVIENKRVVAFHGWVVADYLKFA